jgi:RNA 3'-terminal phosphate cyclase (ATP)
MITIDGNQKSGSGTIVRDAAGLAALSGTAIHMTNIRARRKKPGLRPQHLTALKAVAELCSGRLEGAAVGASEIVFKPGGRMKNGVFRWDIGTAGSATMFAMTVIPVALFAGGPSVYHITGGLFQDFAPTVLFVKYVFIPTLQSMGADIDLIIHKPGYVPEGGGYIELRIKPLGELNGLRRERRGEIIQTSGISLSSRLKKRKVSERMADASCKIMKRAGLDPEIDVIYDEEGSPAFDEAAVQPGAGFFLRAETDTGWREKGDSSPIYPIFGREKGDSSPIYPIFDIFEKVLREKGDSSPIYPIFDIFEKVLIFSASIYMKWDELPE